MSPERIVKLETKVSYQEDLIQELSRIVAEQEKRLTRQEKWSELMIEKFKELTDMLEETPVNQKPPHY